jgi:hypothetical protein
MSGLEKSPHSLPFSCCGRAISPPRLSRSRRQRRLRPQKQQSGLPSRMMRILIPLDNLKFTGDDCGGMDLSGFVSVRNQIYFKETFA